MEDNLKRALFISWLRSRGARTALCPVPPTLSHLWKPRRLQLRKPPGSSLRCPGQAFNLPSAVPCSMWSLPSLCLLRACSRWLPVFRNWGQWSAFKNLEKQKGSEMGQWSLIMDCFFPSSFPSFLQRRSKLCGARGNRPWADSSQVCGAKRWWHRAWVPGSGSPPPQPRAARAATGAGGYSWGRFWRPGGGLRSPLPEALTWGGSSSSRAAGFPAPLLPVQPLYKLSCSFKFPWWGRGHTARGLGAHWPDVKWVGRSLAPVPGEEALRAGGRGPRRRGSHRASASCLPAAFQPTAGLGWWRLGLPAPGRWCWKVAVRGDPGGVPVFSCAPS